MLILLWLACADPEFKPVARAMEHYDRGQTALANGAPVKAADAFSDAADADPARPVLRGWQAWALDQAGDAEGALSVLDAALLAHPGAVELRYNRAAIRARTGKLAAAAADLEWIYANDAMQPVEVGEDQDFASLSTHAEYKSLVPTAQVQADMIGERGSVLLGEPFTLELTVVSRAGSRVHIDDVGEATGLLRHTRTVEDMRPDGPLWTRRRVRVVYTAVGAGSATLGPWLVKSGGTSALTERVKVEVVALPGQKSAGEASEATAVRLPSGMSSAAAPPWVGVVDQQRVVRLGARHSLLPRVPDPPGPVFELWSEGQVQWRQLPLPQGVFEVMDGGKVVATSD